MFTDNNVENAVRQKVFWETFALAIAGFIHSEKNESSEAETARSQAE